MADTTDTEQLLGEDNATQSPSLNFSELLTLDATLFDFDEALTQWTG